MNVPHICTYIESKKGTCYFKTFSQVCNFANPACLKQQGYPQRSQGSASRGRGGKKKLWTKVKKLWDGERGDRQRDSMRRGRQGWDGVREGQQRDGQSGSQQRDGMRGGRQRKPRSMRSFSPRGLWQSFRDRIQSFARKAKLITGL